MKRALLLGCGSARDRRLFIPGDPGDPADWGGELVTLDHTASHRPDVVHDLNITPWPFEDDSFDRVDAYELLEHLGQQGDAASFFATFFEAWRILKPGGFLAATTPSYKGLWAWSDPSHRRIISSGSLVFLDQNQYRAQVGLTSMSDLRPLWRGDFEVAWADMRGEADGTGFSFVLRAIKPARR